MKWLKLDCDFPSDPKIKCLSREWGGETAAAFWVLLMAYVGGNSGATCRIKVDEFGVHSPNVIATFMQCKPKVLLRRLERSSNINLIDRESWANEHEIFIPNMLRRLDEYSAKVRRKSGHSPDIVQSAQTKSASKSAQTTSLSLSLTREEKLLSGEDSGKENVSGREQAKRIQAGCEKLWARYPSKDGRKEAEKHYKASVKTDQDIEDAEKALTNYEGHLRSNTWKQPQAGKTWFNNWRDWLTWVEVGRNGTHQNGSGRNGAEPPGSTSTQRTKSGDPIYIPKQ